MREGIVRDPRLWAVLVPVVLVAGLAVWSLLPMAGERILLETTAVDPPDPFRGDYALLAYEQADIGASSHGMGGVARGQRVYLTLQEGPEADPGGRPYWQVVQVTPARPDLADDQVCIRAEVDRVSGASFHVTMGIEAYFVQKDQDFEDWQGKQVSVVVAVRDCTPRIAGLRLDGVPWDG